MSLVRGKIALGVVAVGCVLFAAGWPLPVTAQSTKRAVEQPCKSAVAPVRYGKILKVSKKTKLEIAAYRRAWARACAKGGGASLNALLLRAGRVKAGMNKAIAATRAQGKRADRLHTQLSKVYPRFVPAMVGSVIEFEFFEPMLPVFKAHLRLGNAEDRAFFASHARLFGGDFKAPPWIERTWDYGGCIRLGRWTPHGKRRAGYNFVAAAGEIARLKATLKGVWYRRQVVALETRMLQALTKLPQLRQKGKPAVIDACGTSAEALGAMRRTAMAFARGHSTYRRAAAGLQRTIAAVETGRVRICETASCPGG